MIANRHPAAWLLAVALVGGSAGCASAGRGAVPAAATAGTDCFDTSRVTSFVPLPGPYLYLEVGSRRHLLLTLDRDSGPLRQANNIVIGTPRFTQVCSGTRTPITYDYLGNVGVYDIIGIETVPSRKAAEEITTRASR